MGAWTCLGRGCIIWPTTCSNITARGLSMLSNNPPVLYPESLGAFTVRIGPFWFTPILQVHRLQLSYDVLIGGINVSNLHGQHLCNSVSFPYSPCSCQIKLFLILELGEKPVLPPLCLLCSPMTTILITLVTPGVCGFSPHQAILCNASWVSYNLPQF